MLIPTYLQNLYGPRRRSRFALTIQVVCLTAVFLVVSAVAVYYSLGYQINWTARSIEQTGMIYLDTKVPNLEAESIINGKSLSTVFPVRYTRIFPGSYTIQIKKPGYQTWQRTVHVEANKVASYYDLVLVMSNPLPVLLDSSITAIADTNRTKDIEIRENELWLNGKFLTRSGDDILAAAWFPDNDHLVYQAGEDLLLADPDARVTQEILHIDKKQPLRFMFKENGRILVYEDPDNVGQLKAIELYEKF